MTELIVTGALPPLPSYGDTICGLICVLVCVLGLIGNTSAVAIFSSELSRKNYIDEKKHCFDVLFVFISFTDVLTCLSMIQSRHPFQGRDPVLFSSSPFCAFWGVLWAILPYFSVFLVAVLSLTRSYMLVRPLCTVRCKYVVLVLIVYLVFLVLRSAVPLLTTNFSTYSYFNDSAICMEVITELNTYWHFKMTANQVQLLLPILPVTVSCAVSFVVLWSRRKSPSSRGVQMQVEATKTILLVTIIYWLCNVPVALNYMYFHIMSKKSYSYDQMYGSVFMYWYSWPLTLVISVGLNSLLNL